MSAPQTAPATPNASETAAGLSPEAAADALETSGHASADAPLTVPSDAAPEHSAAADASPSAAVVAGETEPRSPQLAKTEDEKKEKKHGRKPFVELLNKIRKPLEKPSHAADKKPETEAVPAVEAALPLSESAPAPADVVSGEPAVDNDTALEAPALEEAAKEVTTPRKERGSHFFEKITAFVMKPKSPKGRKLETEEAKLAQADAPAEAAVDGSSAPEAAATSSVPVDAPEPSTAVEAEPESAAPETSTAPAENKDDAGKVEKKEDDVKVERKEKSPKDLAKLARRFSGRLFGIEKKEKDKPVKKAEATQEEELVEEPSAPPAEEPAEALSQPLSDNSPPEQSAESNNPASEATPVIAAAA